MSFAITTHSAEETIRFGKIIATSLKPGDVVAFIGELAAGKTTLINGICQGLNMPRPVESPTFTLVNEYPGPIYHIDCYREQRLSEWLELGINQYFYGEGVTFVEWADRIRPLLPERTLYITLRQDFDRDTIRNIEVDGPPAILSTIIAKLQTLQPQLETVNYKL